MRTRQTICLNPNRTNFSSLTTIQTLSFVQDSTAHSLFFYIMIVTVNHFDLFVSQFLFSKLSFIFFNDCIKGIGTLMFVSARCCHFVCFSITFVMDILAQFIVIHFMAVLTFNRLTTSFHQFHLSLTLNLDGFVSDLDSFQHVRLLDFIHFTFHHHDVVQSSADHDIDICFLQLCECRVDYELSTNTSYTYFGNRSVEWNIRNCQSSRSCKTSQGIRHILTVCREQYDIYINFSVVVIWEKRT